MPENARVFLLEDSGLVRKALTQKLVEAGHTVVFDAGSLPEAEPIIPQLVEKGVQVALLDDNLDAYNEENHDGSLVAEKIHLEAPGVKIVDISNMGSIYGHVHALARKAESPENFKNIVEAVTRV